MSVEPSQNELLLKSSIKYIEKKLNIDNYHFFK